jgi:hypothetical protein
VGLFQNPEVSWGLVGGILQHPVSKTILPKGLKKILKNLDFTGSPKKFLKNMGSIIFFYLTLHQFFH